MFNPIGIVICTKSLQYFDIANNFRLYSVSLIVVISTAAIPYELFEKRFLNKNTVFQNYKR